MLARNLTAKNLRPSKSFFNIASVAVGQFNFDTSMNAFLETPLPTVDFIETGSFASSSRDTEPKKVLPLLIGGKSYETATLEWNSEQLLNKPPKFPLFPFHDEKTSDEGNQESGAAYYCVEYVFRELQRMSSKFRVPVGNSTLPHNSSLISDGFIRSVEPNARISIIEFKPPLVFEKGKDFIDLWSKGMSCARV